MLRITALALSFALFSSFAVIPAEPAPDASRGELLYAKNCLACHTAQVHWRERKLATNWKTLLAQVRRWQEALELKWSDEDIARVGRYLNTHHYHYPVVG
jgi:mono/diheme cytochrome c family protein